MPPVETHKAQPLGVEVELDLAHWAVAVLGDDEIGDILELRIVWLVVARPAACAPPLSGLAGLGQCPVH